jgi:hypothetical protein
VARIETMDFITIVLDGACDPVTLNHLLEDEGFMSAVDRARRRPRLRVVPKEDRHALATAGIHNAPGLIFRSGEPFTSVCLSVVGGKLTLDMILTVRDVADRHIRKLWEGKRRRPRKTP